MLRKLAPPTCHKEYTCQIDSPDINYDYFCVTFYAYTVYLSYPAGNYMFKVKNRNTRTRCEICSKLTMKTPERR